MKTIFSCIVFIICVVLINANAENDIENTIKNLEKEKNELVIKIQEAIDDSVKALEKNNDSDSMAGLQHLQELKKHFNETAVEVKNLSASRRSEQPRYIQKGKVKLDLFDIASLFGKKEKVNKLVREKNQAIMREKLKEWIKQKEQERKKIKAYKEKMNIISEKCPRNGLGSAHEKKKKKSRRALGSPGLSGEDGKSASKGESGEPGKSPSKGQSGEPGKSPSKGQSGEKKLTSAEKRKKDRKEKREKRRQEKAAKKKAKRKKYPCCRKCCKRSYLGCL